MAQEVIEVSFFKKFQEQGNAQMKALVGRINNRDFLPAFASAMALIVAADGVIQDDEIQGVMDFVTTDPTLAHWKLDDRTKAFQEAINLANGGAMKQVTLWGNVAKLNGKPEAPMLADLVLALANADGDFADSEKAVFDKICRRVGLDPKNYI